MVLKEHSPLVWRKTL